MQVSKSIYAVYVNIHDSSCNLPVHRLDWIGIGRERRRFVHGRLELDRRRPKSK